MSLKYSSSTCYHWILGLLFDEADIQAVHGQISDVLTSDIEKCFMTHPMHSFYGDGGGCRVERDA